MKRRRLLACLLLASGQLSAADAPAPPPSTSPVELSAGVQPDIPSAPPVDPATVPLAGQRTGLDIYARFREGLADPDCDAAATGGRWKKQFGHAPGQLAKTNDDLLPLFGYVVDALHDAHLPTEYALIPFVESGYKPGARSASGPAGLWQLIGTTAKNHGVPMRAGYDGRLSPVDSTQAAVRYLKTLHGMFGGDWRLAVMAYNAGEYRILQSMRRAGMNAQNAKPAELPSLSGITYAYVEKLHALACIFQQADDGDEWLQRLDRPVPLLAAHPLPKDAATLEGWAARQGHDSGLLKRLNPALAGKFSRGDKPLRVLAPEGAVAIALAHADLPQENTPGSMSAASMPTESAKKEAAVIPATLAAGTATAADVSTHRSHTVRRGESAWIIAKRYGLPTRQLLTRNGLSANSVLRPGMVLSLDEEAP
ncbi:transglycosylase SLT domain-containing protein [Pseudoxanthomonas sp. UTMC 1351]|uniref:lytic transglycosylase domain-containing protein n=1 Tax=Pseudoxanthomonas sp. UTMC 1351 TaxID=2695853 RepID=UPI0034CEFD3A